MLCAEGRCPWVLEGKSLTGGVASTGKRQRGQMPRQSGDGADHGGEEDLGFCSAAKGSLWRTEI